MDSGIKPQPRQKSPYETASIFSKFTFWWLRDLFKIGLTRTINEDDMYETLKSHESGPLSDKFSKLWEEELKAVGRKPSLLRVIVKMFGTGIIGLGIMYSCTDTLAKILQPLCLGGLVSFFAAGQTTISKDDAYLYALGIILCSFISIIIFHPFLLYVFQTGMRIRVACCSLLYKKALKLTKSVTADGLSGQVINLMSNDVARFDTATGYVNDFWKGPLELVLLGFFIYREVGFAGLAGIGFLLCFIPIQLYIGKKSATFRLKTARKTDIRVRLMNELIQGIQVIKMYAWEKSFAQIVDKIRKSEIKAFSGTLYIRGTLLSFSIVSRFSIFLSLISFVYFGNVLTARKVFIVTSYFNQLYISMLHFWPLCLTYIGEGLISVKRIEDFLLMSEKKVGKPMSKKEKRKMYKENGMETDPMLVKNNQTGRDYLKREVIDSPKERGVVFSNATAAYCTDGVHSYTGVKSINLNIESGKVCAIIGPVGSGKSTLLNVILGELDLDEGNLTVNGKISYASQDMWLFEGSVRRNIVFIEEFDEKRYYEVIKVCSLERDLDLLPLGDSTIVGERGISLSGGQRARVNLARAIYRKADIYLLDDPLSAVDTQVGKHIFEKCIQGFLKDKVCVLVTHQLQYLKKLEQVVLMDNGKIEAQGSFKALSETKVFCALSGTEEAGNQEADHVQVNEVKNEIKNGDAKQISDTKEAQTVGAIGFGVYKSYFKSVDSVLILIWVAFLFVAAQVSLSGVDLLVSKWVNHEDSITYLNGTLHANFNSTENRTDFSDFFEKSGFDVDQSNFTVIQEALNEKASSYRENHIRTYTIWMACLFVLMLRRSFSFYKMCLRASRNLHDKLFRSITRATMFFFNNNTSGRILNRFSKDIGLIDTNLPVALMDCTIFFLEFIAIIILVSIVNYWLLLPTFVMSIIFYLLRRVYVNTARCVKRVEAMSRSPVFSHANATFQGLSTIRAFQAETVLIKEFDKHQDLNTSAFYLYTAATRAFALWLELVCVVYMATVTLSFLVIGNESLGGSVGLAITQVFNLIFMCQWGMRQTAELENQMTSVERVREYSELPSEPPLESESKYRPPVEWPQHGRIKFSNLYLQYSESSDFVLRDLSFIAEPMEKIGIVGRTGAGKSSIIQALFRLAVNKGSIEIDGIDIQTLGLHDLRKKIAIIPQDPILFSGSLRMNLDPFLDKTDDEIWSALTQVELKLVVSSLPQGLETKVSDGGSNFSTGQRQLVCLARAILRDNNILILDEATANVDPETDSLIQKTIRTQFANSTVLTIAHRLHTVMDSDRVLVMDAGRALEYAHPFELLQRQGKFRMLVDQSGAATASLLTAVAEESFKKKKESKKDH